MTKLQNGLSVPSNKSLSRWQIGTLLWQSNPYRKVFSFPNSCPMCFRWTSTIKEFVQKNIWWQCVWGKECVQTLVKGKKQNFSFVFFFSRILDQHPRAAIQSVCTEISIILFICLSKNCHTFVRGRLSNPPSFTCLHKHTFYKVPQWVISCLFELMPVWESRQRKKEWGETEEKTIDGNQWSAETN